MDNTTQILTKAS